MYKDDSRSRDVKKFANRWKTISGTPQKQYKNNTIKQLNGSVLRQIYLVWYVTVVLLQQIYLVWYVTVLLLQQLYLVWYVLGWCVTVTGPHGCKSQYV